MRSKLMVLGLASLLAATVAVGGVTLALFTSQAANQNNTFTAGTVDIEVDNPGAWSAFYNNMAPGDTVTKTITVKNAGSLELEFVTVRKKSGALFGGATPATVLITNGMGVLAPGATQAVTVAVSLPLAADNAYQTATGNLDLEFTAFQTRNVTTEAATPTYVSTVTAPWGTVYDVYKFYDTHGNLIYMNAATILSFSEQWPDGTIRSYEVGNDNDPNYYLPVTRPAGTYTYFIMAKSGVKYTATITHPHP